ncbi:RelA/SpoT domain-containing protein [Alloacidobacterium dinghuense]|uniref:RelA/SpoT domain-containing protein n=1 Tax=Alloacidobacterium dinghuense TaxID=2763107 RepID=A0A7G8BJR4_9BACT|nr:RelA/SpoT domain-containing protein [Alloacidobacterium dinghuense]QNI32784.1 RelA/SpoT domain-containing protein [Alloacidobacterium dinghuense]
MDFENSTGRADVESVLADFDRRKDNLVEFCNKTKTLIEECLKDASIHFQSVQARVKGRDKLKTKYLDPSKNYKNLDDITDLAGLRVITYYEDEVDSVAEIIKREFAIDSDKSVDKRETQPDRFGYYALNLICTHSSRRVLDVQYKKFTNVCCEIQITSILRHAWSEIEHSWYDLKESFPDHIKRRFYRIAALLEIAETEFLDIRKQKADYSRAIAVQVESEVPELLVDPISLQAFVDQEPLVHKLDNVIADLLQLELHDEFPEKTAEMRARAANLAGLKTLRDLRKALKQYEEGIVEYVSRCRSVWHTGPSSTSHLQKGLCIYHLAMMLLAIRGNEVVLEALKSLRINPSSAWNVTGQIAIAQEVMAKYDQLTT